MIERHKKSLTQGSIFSHALASDISTDVFGLVITARCDLTHGKISLVNYVPLIPLKEWIKSHANGTATQRLLKSETASARQKLATLGESRELIDYFSSSDIETHLQAHTKEKKTKSIFDSLVKNLQRRDELLAYEAADKFDAEFYEANRKEFNQVVAELCENKAAEFHFFNSIRPDNTGNSYVALLREIRFIPIALADKICGGFDIAEYNEIVTLHKCDPNSLSLISEDCFCESVGTVRSPEIEFIMQRATSLFSRIGVEDLPAEVVERLKKVKIEDDF